MLAIDTSEVDIMSLIKFKFCPFCGADMPPNQVIKFCPFCGEKFLVAEDHTPEPWHQTITVQQKNDSVLKQSNEHQQYAEIDFADYNKQKNATIIDSEYYSIILKHVSNKQSLVSKLDKVLLRGAFAIRLAVDNMPAIIVYKAKGNDVRYYNELFIEEQATISIIAGDFDSKPLVEQVFSSFEKLNVTAQRIIKPLPINLWIGDTICGVFSNTSQQNNEGITVVTDKNIFFLPLNTELMLYPWFVRSYALLSKIVQQDHNLELVYQEKTVASINFTDKQQLETAYKTVKAILPN